MASEIKLGVLIGPEAQRDAIHIAVAPAVACEKLYPGQDIGFAQAVCKLGVVSRPKGALYPEGFPAIGIVDPFLTGPVFPGQRFWMFLYPQTITSLRHDWTHPAFEAAPPATVEESAVAVEALDAKKAGQVPDLAGSLSQNVAAARDVLECTAERAGMTYAVMMERAGDFLETAIPYTEYGYETARNSIYDLEGGAAEFWRCYEIVTGKKVDPENKHDSPFSCSC